MKKFWDALKCYDSAIKKNPENPDYYNNKGKTLEDMNFCEAALECYNEAILRNPNHSTYINNKARILSKLSRMEEALE